MRAAARPSDDPCVKTAFVRFEPGDVVSAERPSLWYVYVLKDQDGRIRYVGMTVDPAGRLRCHLAANASPRIRGWVREQGGRVTMTIVSVHETKGDARRVESSLISSLPDLLNEAFPEEWLSPPARERAAERRLARTHGTM